jgi:hypothetical protein
MRILLQTRKAILARLRYNMKKREEEEDLPLIVLKKIIEKRHKQEQLESELFSQSMNIIMED